MKCTRCNKQMSEVNGMIPIEPKGTKDRKWVCTNCATNEEIDNLDCEVKELSNIINPNFLENKYDDISTSNKMINNISSCITIDNGTGSSGIERLGVIDQLVPQYIKFRQDKFEESPIKNIIKQEE